MMFPSNKYFFISLSLSLFLSVLAGWESDCNPLEFYSQSRNKIPEHFWKWHPVRKTREQIPVAVSPQITHYRGRFLIPLSRMIFKYLLKDFLNSRSCLCPVKNSSPPYFWPDLEPVPQYPYWSPTLLRHPSIPLWWCCTGDINKGLDSGWKAPGSVCQPLWVAILFMQGSSFKLLMVSDLCVKGFLETRSGF